MGGNKRAKLLSPQVKTKCPSSPRWALGIFIYWLLSSIHQRWTNDYHRALTGGRLCWVWSPWGVVVVSLEGVVGGVVVLGVVDGVVWIVLRCWIVCSCRRRIVVSLVRSVPVVLVPSVPGVVLVSLIVPVPGVVLVSLIVPVPGVVVSVLGVVLVSVWLERLVSVEPLLVLVFLRSFVGGVLGELVVSVVLLRGGGTVLLPLLSAWLSSCCEPAFSKGRALAGYTATAASSTDKNVPVIILKFWRRMIASLWRDLRVESSHTEESWSTKLWTRDKSTPKS